MPIASGWLRLDASGKVAAGPVLLFGVYINAAVSGATVTLYNAIDAITGSKVMDIIVDGEATEKVIFPSPVYCEAGLYATLDSDVDELILIWLPASER